MISTNLLENGIKVIIEETDETYYNGLQLQILPDGRIRQGCFMKPEPWALLDEKHTIFKFCIYTDDRTLEDSS